MADRKKPTAKKRLNDAEKIQKANRARADRLAAYTMIRNAVQLSKGDMTELTPKDVLNHVLPLILPKMYAEEKT